MRKLYILVTSDKGAQVRKWNGVFSYEPITPEYFTCPGKLGEFIKRLGIDTEETV